MTTISLDEEVRLYTTNAEREKYNTLATLYGIIVTLDYLERAYVRDAITAAECVCFVSEMRRILSPLQEIFARLYAASVPVQDHVETRWT